MIPAPSILLILSSASSHPVGTRLGAPPRYPSRLLTAVPTSSTHVTRTLQPVFAFRGHSERFLNSVPLPARLSTHAKVLSMGGWPNNRRWDDEARPVGHRTQDTFPSWAAISMLASFPQKTSSMLAPRPQTVSMVVPRPHLILRSYSGPFLCLRNRHDRRLGR